MPKLPKFDPEQFSKDRKSVKLRKEMEERMASRQPVVSKERKIEPLTERVVFGMGSRNRMSKRMGK